jgi:polyhydroxyalkanoate synthase
VLSSGGHIAGIVNPPGPKAWFETADFAGSDPEAWRSAAVRRNGSWWEDWTAWSDARAGDLVEPPTMGSGLHPVIADAPGEYVFG